MLVSLSHIKYPLEDVYILKIGTFYFFEKFMISEFNEGVIVSWESVQEVITIAETHYGPDKKIAYISNRVYSYSIYPQDWLKFFETRKTINAFAVISYSNLENSGTLIEKLFFKNRIRKFKSLTTAIEWAVKINEAEDSSSKLMAL